MRRYLFESSLAVLLAVLPRWALAQPVTEEPPAVPLEEVPLAAPLEDPPPRTHVEAPPEPLAAEPAVDATEDEIAKALAEDAADTADAAATISAPASTAAAFLPNLSFVASFAGAYHSDPSLATGAHDPVANGPIIQALELTIDKAVDPYFRLDGTLVFSAEGAELEELFATTTNLPHSLQLRAGQFLTRFGRINSMHLHAWDFIDQSFPISRIFGGEGNRGPGIELSYLTPLPFYVEVIASATDAGEGARSFFGDSGEPINSLFDLQSTFAVKQFHELGPNLSLAHGISAATGPNPTSSENRTNVFGTDLYLKYRPVTRASYTAIALHAEYLYRHREVPNDRLRDHSLLVTASWRIAKRWSTAARYELGTPARTKAGVEEGADYLDPEWTANRQRASLVVAFAPTEFSRIRGQFGLDYPAWQDDPIASAIASLEVLIGSHAAHAF